MKKENRKLAQERRAAERAAKERNAKLKFWVPALLILAAVIALVFMIIKTSGDGAETAAASSSVSAASQADETAASSAAQEVAAPVLNTEEGTVAKDGDTVNIDFVGTIDGVEFEGGNTNGQGSDLTLGSHRFIDNFEEQIVGHAVGETFDVVVTFPEDYHATELAGKEAVFATTLNGIYE